MKHPNFFQEDNFSFSMARLLSFMVVVIALFGFIMLAIKTFNEQPLVVNILTSLNNKVEITGYNVIQPDYSYIVLWGAIITGMLTAAFALKWLSKADEQKVTTTPTP